jgi:predicted negative regulator of RcsB-dependent stress response
MRTFLVIIVLVGLGVLFLWQKQNETPPSAAANFVVASKSVTKPQPKPELTPTPRGQASEYNYMKRALDRAADVRDQARARTKESQDP